MIGALFADQVLTCTSFFLYLYFPIFIKININTDKNTFDRIYLNFRSMRNLYFLGPNLAKFPLTLINGHNKYDMYEFIGDTSYGMHKIFHVVCHFFISNYRTNKFATNSNNRTLFPGCPCVRPYDVTLRI